MVSSSDAPAPAIAPRILEGEWQNVITRNGLIGAPPEQLRMMRRAFFDGANAYSRHRMFAAWLDTELNAHTEAIVQGRA